MRRPFLTALAAVAAASTLLTGCGSSSSGSGSGSSTSAASGSSSAALSGQITVLAAASLTESFTAIGKAFEAAHPGTKVVFSFGASSTLATQITQGAPADVFASADTATMDKLTTAGLNGAAPVTFATNLLSIITGPGNPKGITGLADLARADLKLVLCDPSVPCGRYAAQSLAKAKVTATPVSLEQNVKGVVTKVTAGEADAGIVYTTDVKAAGAKAAGVAIPADQNVVATYPIASTMT